MEYTEKIRDATTAAPSFKEISNFLNFLQETFAPLLAHKDGEINVKHSKDKASDKVTTTLHKNIKKQSQMIPDVKSQDEFPTLGMLVKKSSSRWVLTLLHSMYQLKHCVTPVQ